MKFSEFAIVSPTVTLGDADEYPYVGMADVTPGQRYVRESRKREYNSGTKFEPGDVLFARITPCLENGKIAQFDGNEKGFGSTEFFVFRARPGVSDDSYLYYLSRTRGIRKPAERSMSGASGRQRADLSVVKNIEVDPPPLPIQRRIAEVLSAYDDLIENNKRRIELLEEMAQAVYREWFVEMHFPGHEDTSMRETDALGPVPEGWEVARLGDLAESPRNRVKPQEEVQPDVPYFGLGDLPKKSIALSEWGRAEDAGSTKYTFNRGDILFGKIRPYFHKVGPAPVAGICSTDAIVIRPYEPVHFGIVLGCVSSEEFVAHATQTSSGTKMPRAKWKILKDYPVPVPPASLLEQFDDIMRTFVEQIHTLIHKNKTLRRTRDFLLPRLVGGEVEVEVSADSTQAMP